MPRRKQTRRMTVQDIRTILRLTHEQGLSVREIGLRLKLSKTTVATYLLRAREAGLDRWPLPPGRDDDATLEAALFQRVGRPPRDLAEPDWAKVATELKRKGVTLVLQADQEHLARPVGGAGEAGAGPRQPASPRNQVLEGEDIGTVTADGADETRRCHSTIIERHATAIIPIRKNGRPWKRDCPAAIVRNETLRTIRHYGRAFWRRSTGYHIRSRIEAKMRCLKAFGKCIAASDPNRQTAQIQIRIALMNCLSALGTAQIIRVA